MRIQAFFKSSNRQLSAPVIQVRLQQYKHPSSEYNPNQVITMTGISYPVKKTGVKVPTDMNIGNP